MITYFNALIHHLELSNAHLGHQAAAPMCIKCNAAGTGGTQQAGCIRTDASSSCTKRAYNSRSRGARARVQSPAASTCMQTPGAFDTAHMPADGQPPPLPPPLLLLLLDWGCSRGKSFTDTLNLCGQDGGACRGGGVGQPTCRSQPYCTCVVWMQCPCLRSQLQHGRQPP